VVSVDDVRPTRAFVAGGIVHFVAGCPQRESEMLHARPLLLLLQLVKTACLIPHANGKASWWIVSTSESRSPRESIYMTSSSSRGEGALRSWTYEQKAERKLHLFPVTSGENADILDTFYIVGTAESDKPGYMAYLSGSKTAAWPFDPRIEDELAQWHFIESDLSADGPSYFIVSTKQSRTPNEMLFLDDWTAVKPWGFDRTDTKCLWRLIPAPPSPPLPDPDEVAQAHTRNSIIGITVGVVLFCCFSILRCGTASRRERTRTYVRQTSRRVLRLPPGAATSSAASTRV